MPCDVDRVLARSCRSCHGAEPSFGAPMPLVTLEDLHAAAKTANGKKVFEQVGVRIHDDAAPMPQPPNVRLDAAETATLDSWIAAGAPAGSVACETVAANGQPEPLKCAADQRLRPASKFTMTDDPDRYVCFGFETTTTTKRHVIAGGPKIDNAKLVHHILLYQTPKAENPVPTPCGPNGGPDWRLVTGWAPGGKNFELPPEAGFVEEVGTTHWAVQVHYNNGKGLVGEVDGTGYDLCSTTDLRPNDADILATGTLMISAPPRAETLTSCDYAFPEAYGNINVISAWPHMHRLGRAQSATRIRDGVETPILDIPSFDYENGGAAVPVSVDVRPGDTLRTKCLWKNTGDATVRFGGGTDAEMCFAFLTYWPKVTARRFGWIVPASPDESICTSTTSL